MVKNMFFPMEGPRGGQEASWTRFGVDLEGFGEGSGRILELKIEVFLVFYPAMATTTRYVETVVLDISRFFVIWRAWAQLGMSWTHILDGLLRPNWYWKGVVDKRKHKTA